METLLFNEVDRVVEIVVAIENIEERVGWHDGEIPGEVGIPEGIERMEVEVRRLEGAGIILLEEEK